MPDLNGNKTKPVSELSELVQSAGIPSINQIITEAGEDLVDRIYFTIATFFTHRRESNHSYARHVVDPMIRDRVWESMEYYNSDATNTVLAIHDNGENIGKTLPGARIINLWDGLIFGGDFEIAGNFMTDYNNQIIKAARKEGAATRDKLGEEIRIDDVIQDMDSVRHLLISNSNIAQEAALERVDYEYHNFLVALDRTDIPDEDKLYVRDLVQKWSNALELARGNFFSETELKEDAVKKIDDLAKSIQSNAEVGEYHFFDDDGSVAYHAAKEASYRFYAWRIARFDRHREARGVTALDGSELRGAKKGDSSDNIRTPKSDNFTDLARLSLKGSIYLSAEEGYHQESGKYNSTLKGKNEARQLEFFKSQLIYRTIADAVGVGMHIDSSFDNSKAWVATQFAGLNETFGEKFMKHSIDMLRKDPNAYAVRGSGAIIEGPEAENLLAGYNLLLKQYSNGNLLEKIKGAFGKTTSNLRSSAASLMF
ncbi:hypothetical protein ISS07_04990 [Candidatus Woesearchaeota archaeon]|nr:hypothetical protein [Candidatus Woesearchaeota archaeon]